MKFTFKKVDGGWLLQLSRDHFGLPTETTRYQMNKMLDMNDMRNLVSLLTIQSKVPMKDGRVDVYALVGDIGPENFSIFKSERFGVGPTKEQIEKGDYSDFPYGRFSGKVEKGKVPLLWDKKPDKQGGRVVGFNGGAVKWLPEAKVQELLEQYNQTQSKPANK